MPHASIGVNSDLVGGVDARDSIAPLRCAASLRSLSSFVGQPAVRLPIAKQIPLPPLPRIFGYRFGRTS